MVPYSAGGGTERSASKIPWGATVYSPSKILPWDWDVDTQVSGATLENMATHHNRTIHEYVSEDQKIRRKYLLDVNPWSRQRDHGDGANIIDARWIDMKNGLYIDITGVSELYPAEKPEIWSCKNFHHYHVRDLYPMRQSVFEGVPAKIPYAYSQILVEEYKLQALANTIYEGYCIAICTLWLFTNAVRSHQWQEDLREWIPVSPKEHE